MFCTAVNCIDGRTQLVVIDYLQQRFDVAYVDMVTEAAPVAILAEGPDSREAESIFRRVAVSRKAHGSMAIAVVAHADCAGNPVPDAAQREQLTAAVETLRQELPEMTAVGLWVDLEGEVHEVCHAKPHGRPSPGSAWHD